MTHWWVLLAIAHLSVYLTASQHHSKDFLDGWRPSPEQEAGTRGDQHISPASRGPRAARRTVQWWIESNLRPSIPLYTSIRVRECWPTRSRRKRSGRILEKLNALYPSVYRVKRGAYWLINPTFQSSEEDVNLLFEMLLGGMQIQDGQRDLLIADAELASLRSVDKLEVICEDVLPKSLPDIRRLTAELARRRRPLSWQDFERTVLTLVYAAQTLARGGGQQRREAWTDAVTQLFGALQKDLGTS
uniref:Protein FAM180A n=1 Tax=Gasterosteus aculeatus aculeatus TaxID=481459 RepID=A0AAQ4RSW9_GASAC